MWRHFTNFGSDGRAADGFPVDPCGDISPTLGVMMFFLLGPLMGFRLIILCELRFKLWKSLAFHNGCQQLIPIGDGGYKKRNVWRLLCCDEIGLIFWLCPHVSLLFGWRPVDGYMYIDGWEPAVPFLILEVSSQGLQEVWSQSLVLGCTRIYRASLLVSGWNYVHLCSSEDEGPKMLSRIQGLVGP